MSPLSPALLADVDLKGEEILILIMLVGTALVLLTLILSITGYNMLRVRATEATRREIAAYVAEGSITADDAAKLLAPRRPPASAAERKLASLVAWGMIKKSDAAALIEARASAGAEGWREMVELVGEGMPAADAIKLVGARNGPASVTPA